MTVATAVQPCTRSTARCADARQYSSELRDCCRAHVIGIMRFLAPELDRMKVRWWADYGTLLGAVRNPQTKWADYPWLSQDGRTTKGPAPGIVPHDKDGDIGILWADWVKVRRLRPALIKAGFHIDTRYTRGSMKVRVSAKNHTNIDLFFWHEKQDGTMYRVGYAQVDQYKGREFHKDMLAPFSRVEWEGMSLPAPRDPTAFLEMRYGPKWRTPLQANNDGVRRGQWNGKRNSRG